MVLVSVTRCWLTPPAAIVMDMVDTTGSLLDIAGLGPEPRVSLDLSIRRLDGLIEESTIAGNLAP